MFDKRGTGLSDRVGALPGMDERMDDVRAVMDAAGIQRAALWGMSEGGPLAALFAATYPDRCRALVLYGAFARFSSWIPTDEAFAALLQYIDQGWGAARVCRILRPLAKTIQPSKVGGAGSSDLAQARPRSPTSCA
jgi:pimeloyl-ACP methyl ester carboxylesterase